MEIIEIRKAVENDLPQIIPLWKELMEFHYIRDGSFEIIEEAPQKFEEYMRKNLKSEENFVFTAFLKTTEQSEVPMEKIIGYCIGGQSKRPPVYKTQKIGVISDIAVSVDHRRKKVGLLLFEEAKKWFVAHELSRFELNVATKNEISKQFWRHLGFEPYMEVMYQESEE